MIGREWDTDATIPSFVNVRPVTRNSIEAVSFDNPDLVPVLMNAVQVRAQYTFDPE